MDFKLPMLYPFKFFEFTRNLIKNVLTEKWNNTDLLYKSKVFDIFILHGEQDYINKIDYSIELFFASIQNNDDKFDFDELKNNKSRTDIDNEIYSIVTIKEEGYLWKSKLKNRKIWLLQLSNAHHSDFSYFEFVKDYIKEWSDL